MTGLVFDLDVPPLDENLTGLVGAVDLGRLKMVMVMVQGEDVRMIRVFE